MSFEIQINAKQVEQLLANEKKEPSLKLHKRLGEAVKDAYRGHFYHLNAERHRGHSNDAFYANVAQRVSAGAYPDGFTVSINYVGIRQRLLGGTITAGSNGSGNKYLTIPASSEAYGKKATDFGGLHVVFGRQRSTGNIGPVALAGGDQGAQPRGYGKGRAAAKRTLIETQGKILYWLVPSVVQMADPSVMPDPIYINQVIIHEAERYINQKNAKSGGSA